MYVKRDIRNCHNNYDRLVSTIKRRVVDLREDRERKKEKEEQRNIPRITTFTSGRVNWRDNICPRAQEANGKGLSRKQRKRNYNSA